MQIALRTNRNLRRSATLVGLLVAEYLALFVTLAVVFDGEDIARLPDLWRMVIGRTTSILGGALLGLGAAVAIWGDRLGQALGAVSVPAGWDGRWLTLHGAAYALFAATSFTVLARPEIAAQGGVALLLLWLLAGIGLVVTLLRAAYGPALVALCRALGGVGLAAGVTGAGAALLLAAVLPYWPLMAGPTLRLSAGILELCCGPVLTDPSAQIIGLENFLVFVDASCSGVEGMALVTLFLGGYLLRFRAEHRFPQALLILPLAVVMSFLANGLRIALLILIGAHVSPEVASGAFHSMAGWIFFCLLSIGFVALSRRIAWFRRPEARAADEDGATENPVAAYLTPFLVWLAVGLATSATVLTLDAFYPLRVVVVVGVLLLLRQGYAGTLPRPAVAASGPAVEAAPWLIGLAVAVAWVLLSPGNTGPASFAEMRAETGWAEGFFLAWIAFRLAGTVLVVPVIEELAFRGYLQRRLQGADFTAVSLVRPSLIAVAGSAAVFGMMHENWIGGILAGVAFSWAAALRGRLMDAIVAHGVANLALSVLALGFGRWDLW